MSINKIRYIARILLLLYIGYFGCVSYFVHKHVYQGVVYIHSHPYKKASPNTENENEPPFETHKHTAAGFFSINQLSNYTSFEACEINHVERVDNIVLDQYIERCEQVFDRSKMVLFRHRAPPANRTHFLA